MRLMVTSTICAALSAGEVALHWTDDQQDPQYARSVAAFDVLSNAVDAKGRKLKIWKLPAPRPLYNTEEETFDVLSSDAVPRTAGERLAGSYVNFLISNQQIIYPLLDSRTDGVAQDLLQQMFPDYAIVGVPAREILLGVAIFTVLPSRSLRPSLPFVLGAAAVLAALIARPIQLI